jgi:hypothetical protein
VSEAEDEKAREARLNELARQKGLRLRKSRRGKYMLVKVERVFGHSERGAPSATLDQIEEHLTREPNYQMYILDPPGR